MLIGRDGPQASHGARVLVGDYLAVREGENLLLTADTASDMAAVDAILSAADEAGAKATVAIMPQLPFQGALADPYIPEPVGAAAQSCDVWIDLAFPYLAGSHVHDQAIKAGRVRFVMITGLDGAGLACIYAGADQDLVYAVQSGFDDVALAGVGRQARITYPRRHRPQLHDRRARLQEAAAPRQAGHVHAAGLGRLLPRARKRARQGGAQVRVPRVLRPPARADHHHGGRPDHQGERRRRRALCDGTRAPARGPGRVRLRHPLHPRIPSRRPARHLPGYIYSSPDIFAEEKERIFMADWLCMGRVEAFATPGDYKTFDVMGDPIVITRGTDGALNAFSNICAHRGVEVAQGEGNMERFSCPYHGWTYDLAGKLIGASYMKDHKSFDPKACRMPPLQLDTWAGWVFVNFDMEAPPLETHLAEFAADFDFLRMGELRLGATLEAELECNWKLVVENIVDVYHMRVVHVETNGRFVTDKAFEFNLRQNGGYVWEYDAGPTTPSGEPIFGRIPWLADREPRFSISGFVRPNLTLFGRIDDVHPTVTWPVAPDRTRAVAYFLFPEESFADPAFETKVRGYTDQLSRTLDEDRDMVRSLQRAMATKRFTPGHMARLEVGVHHVINHYLDRMFTDG